MKKKIFAVLFGTMIIISLVACGKQGKEEGQEAVEFTDEEIVKEDQVVAKVNETEILGSEFNSTYMQIKVRLHQFRQDISDLELLRDQTLDILIDQELLIQEADRLGIEVTEEEIEKQFSEAKEEAGQERFTSFLEQYKMTEKDFKDQLRYSMLHEKYITTEIPDIEITEEEIKENYDKLKDQIEDFPDLEEVEEQLKSDLMNQKELELVQDKIDQLRKEAEIEKLI